MEVMVIEDSAVIREILQTILAEIPVLRMIGYEESEAGAIKSIDAKLPDVVVLDISLKPGSGVAVLEHVKKHHPQIAVIVLTNYVDDFYFRRCENAGADFFFDKTFQIMQVRAALLGMICQRQEEGRLLDAA